MFKWRWYKSRSFVALSKYRTYISSCIFWILLLSVKYNTHSSVLSYLCHYSQGVHISNKSARQVILFWLFLDISNMSYWLLEEHCFSITIGLHIMYVLLLKEVDINVISCEENKIENLLNKLCLNVLGIYKAINSMTSMNISAVLALSSMLS